MKILGIETSCDETAAAIVEIDEKNGFIQPLSNVISSQIKLHARWGGVVPNLAAREHLKNILPVINASLAEAKVAKNDIDLIAVTNGPGLIPALMIGTNAAKTIAYAWKKPMAGIHHIEGHIYANFISKRNSDIKFPALCLVVSGGHTQLIMMKKHLTYEIIGETQDDAAGEAFDKVARILGLSYPGGPEIAKQAAKLKKATYGITLPRPMLNKSNFDFSFSGLKTAVLYLVKKNEHHLQDKKFIREVAHEFQQAVIDVLVSKTILAAKKFKPASIFLAGGVSANEELQRQLQGAISSELPDTIFSFPELSYQLDNAAMIATAAYFRLKKISTPDIAKLTYKKISANANLKLNDTKK